MTRPPLEIVRGADDGPEDESDEIAVRPPTDDELIEYETTEVPKAVDPPKVKLGMADLIGLDLPDRKLIVPLWARSWKNLKFVAWWVVRYSASIASFHLVRLPKYAVRTVVRFVVGTLRAIGRYWSWLWDLEGRQMARAAHAGTDQQSWKTARREWQETVHRRLIGSGVGAVAAMAAVTAAYVWAPPAVTALAIVVVAAVLVHLGRPEDTSLTDEYLTSRPDVVWRMTSRIVLDALSGLGIASLSSAIREDPRSGVGFTEAISHDGPGWRVVVDLPKGVTAGDVIEKREKLAAGLRRPLGTVWPEGVKGSHPGRLLLYVGDEDMSTANQPPWNLLKAGAVDLFRPAPFGVDQRMRPVWITLMFASMIIGAVPRMGKTFALRLLLLIAALDVRTKVYAFDKKGSGDLSPLEHVAHAYTVGDEPEDIAVDLREMRGLREEMRRRYKLLRSLPKDQVPESKITPELASDPRHGLEPVVVGVDECFPAGTLIGSTPIEDVRAGMLVPSWDEQGKRFCVRHVVATKRTVPTGLVRVVFKGGATVVCTPNHPFMTNHGWRRAGAFVAGTEVLASGQASSAVHRSILNLRNRIRGPLGEKAVLQEVGSVRLFRALLAGVVRSAGAQWSAGGRQEAAVGKHAGPEPYASTRRAGARLADAAGHRAPASLPWWERPWAHRASAPARGGVGLANGAHRSDRAEGQWFTDALQAGHRQPDSDGGGGGRRWIALRIRSARARRAEGSLPAWQRVDRVEVLQPGGDGRYGGLCPDGFVYNFEVEGTHTYLVGDGLVAHNCQVWYEHKKYGEEFTEICTDLVKRGPAAGIIPIFATQRPDAKSIPKAISDNAVLRFCLKVMEWGANDMVLGSGAYKSGVRATMFARHDLGIGWLAGEGDDAQVVRASYVNTAQAEVVAKRARGMRERAGRLTGYAAGQQLAPEESYSLADDLPRVFVSSERLHSEDILQRLQELRPGTYDGWTPTTLAMATRDQIALSTKQIKIAGVTLAGLRRADVMSAVEAASTPGELAPAPEDGKS